MLSKMYCKAIVVACLVVGLGLFVGSARADTIYTYDFDGLSTASELVGQDNWTLQGTNHDNDVRTGAAGWSGKYVENDQNRLSNAYRPNNDDWSYSLQNNYDFDFSIVVRTHDDDCYEIGALCVDGSTGNDMPLLWVRAYLDDFLWQVGSTDGGGVAWTHTIQIPNASDTIYMLGIKGLAEGNNKYTLKPYYKESGDADVTYATTAQHVTVRDLSQLNSLKITLRSYDPTNYKSRLDDFSITKGDVYVPEPGTLVLLAAGLIGLLAYAWRKRK